MAIKREYFPEGYEGKIYVTPENPANNPQLEVKELDCKLTLDPHNRILLYAYVNGGWELVNTWENIFNKPNLAPSPHDWYGEHHTGDRPLKVKEHGRNNPVHVAIRLEAILMSQTGAARAGSTMI